MGRNTTMMAAAVLFLVAAAATPIGAEKAKPHVFFVLVDDLGWGDVGFHRETPVKDVVTPNIDRLASEGVKLERHYVHMMCTPTRTSLQSGRLPVHSTLQLKNPENPACGMARNMTGIAEVMSRGGYRTHLVGKWDVGMATPKHTPRGRGYETSLGYFEHKNDFWTMKAMQSKCNTSTDLWDTDKPAPELVGSMYEEELFEKRVTDIIDAHNPAEPLFMVYTPHVAHCPLQVPEGLYERFLTLTNGTDEDVCQISTPSINPSNPKFACRAQYNAMVNYLDGVIGNLTSKLQAKGMWSNTLMVFSSDNGGPMRLMESGANNWPLRGGKYSPWEGGIRATAFASGGFLPPSVRGTVQPEMMHIVDWYATFASFAGVDPTDHAAEASGLPPIDSLDIWPLLSGQVPVSPRVEIPVTANLLVQGQYKLILGTATYASWGGPFYPNNTSPQNAVESVTAECGSGCLYDVVNDPHELHDLAAAQPGIVSELTSRLVELRRGFWENNERGVDSCPPGTPPPCACWMAVHKYGNFLGPFQEVSV